MTSTPQPASTPPAPQAQTAAAARRKARRRYYPPRKKACPFCVDKNLAIDYKNIVLLKRFISEQMKIEPRRKTGVCAKHQRRLATAIKRARHLALLPFVPDHPRKTGWTAPAEPAPAPAAPPPPSR
ncbi:MAG: 30S ribosomal protein S18 [Dehalococcoidia bacterium]|nr:30S ribosomal protein S18 [Dehalococcoidia bacterium]MDW8120057.1 30S ribosomal protein S18 [Chloroflexota bacterium]